MRNRVITSSVAARSLHGKRQENDESRKKKLTLLDTLDITGAPIQRHRRAAESVLN
jgi:hypothetical protein